MQYIENRFIRTLSGFILCRWKHGYGQIVKWFKGAYVLRDCWCIAHFSRGRKGNALSLSVMSFFLDFLLVAFYLGIQQINLSLQRERERERERERKKGGSLCLAVLVDWEKEWGKKERQGRWGFESLKESFCFCSLLLSCYSPWLSTKVSLFLFSSSFLEESKESKKRSAPLTLFTVPANPMPCLSNASPISLSIFYSCQSKWQFFCRSLVSDKTLYRRSRCWNFISFLFVIVYTLRSHWISTPALVTFPSLYCSVLGMMWDKKSVVARHFNIFYFGIHNAVL